MRVSDVLRVSSSQFAVPLGSGPNGCELLGEPAGGLRWRGVWLPAHVIPARRQCATP